MKIICCILIYIVVALPLLYLFGSIARHGRGELN